MKIRKGIVTAILVILGFFAVHLAVSNPQTRGLLARLAEERGLSPSMLKTALEQNLPETGEGESPLPGAFGGLPPFPSQVELPEAEEETPVQPPKTVLPTTIAGGMVITNSTGFELDLMGLVAEGTSVRLNAEGPQILIIHTHGSEAYTPDETSQYLSSDNFRTQEPEYSTIRVGDELAACLESYGLSVLHDTGVYDYPSYTGSYGRSEYAVKKYLEEHPSISVVLDIHRDAIGEGDVVYKTVAEGSGKPSAQLMLLAGTGENGLAHPQWQENLRFALYLQSAAVKKHPSLCRPIALKKERYNQHLSTGSLILEVGSSGNTLEEALNAVRYFAEAAGPALKELVQEG